MKVIRALLLSAIPMTGLCLSPTFLHAQNIMYQCNSCTETQHDAMAKTFGPGNHLIADFANNVLKAYHITREPNGVGGYVLEADPETPTTLQQQTFDAYHTLIVTHHASSIVMTLSGSPRPPGYPTRLDSGSAIDWATEPSYQSLIQSWMENLQQRAIDDDWLSGTVSAALFTMQSGIVASGYDRVIDLVIVSRDGSTIRFTWDDGKLKLLSVTDQYGNNIPIRNYDGATNFNGKYNIPAANPTYGQALVNYLNKLGALITVNPSKFPIAIVCVGAKCTVDQVY